MKCLPTCSRFFKLFLFASVAIASASAQTYNPAYTTSTFAGDPGTSGDGDGTGTNAGFGLPEQVATDKSGNLYVADTTNDTVREISPQAAVTTIAGSPGSSGSANGTTSSASFNNPTAVAVDSSGNIYVADAGNNVIRKISSGVVTTFAGQFSSIGGYADGMGTAALFANPFGVAVDSVGNVYVADEGNRVIRKITAAGVVSTLAGLAHNTGSANGTGSSASFNDPEGLAVDSQGNVYVADTGNSTIRLVTPAGVVTTLAGLPPVSTGNTSNVGATDGTGSAARFSFPIGITVDAAGYVYVADTGNSSIRRISPAGVVTTLCGDPPNTGTTDGTGAAARFTNPFGVAVDSTGNLYVGDTYNYTIRKAVSSVLGISLQPQSQSVTAGSSVTFTVAATGPSALTFQWLFNGVAISGATGTSYTVSPVEAGNQGSYSVVVSDGSGSVTSSTAVLSINGNTQPTVSSLANQTVYSGSTVTFSVTATGGSLAYQWYFNNASISGANSSTLVLTNVTTSQGGYYSVGVSNGAGSAISNLALLTVVPASSEAVPTISSNPLSQTVTAGGTATFSVTSTGPNVTYQWYLGTTAISGANSATLTLTNVGTNQAGSYTVTASNAAGSATSAAATLTVNYSARLINLSARADVGAGGNILIAGFGTSGTGSKNLLLRGVGPGLAATFNIAGTLSNPQLTLYDNNSTAIVTDIGWGNAFTLGSSSVHVSPVAATSTLMSTVGAFSLATGSADSAMEVTAPVGSYTAQVSGVGGASGIALAEIYDADTGTPTARLINLSARSEVGVGGNILIGGFVVTGSTPETVLIRGIGPGLASTFNITGTLPNPELSLYDGNSVLIATNLGWGSAPVLGPSPVQAGIQQATASVMSTVGAFSLTAGSADSAMVATLPPGDYTAEVSDFGTATGIALVEVYEVP